MLGVQDVLPKRRMKGGIRWKGYFAYGYREVERPVTGMLWFFAQNTCDRGRASPDLSPLQVVAVPRLSSAMVGHWFHSRAGFGLDYDYELLRVQWSVFYS